MSQNVLPLPGHCSPAPHSCHGHVHTHTKERETKFRGRSTSLRLSPTPPHSMPSSPASSLHGLLSSHLISSHLLSSHPPLPLGFSDSSGQETRDPYFLSLFEYLKEPWRGALLSRPLTRVSPPGFVMEIRLEGGSFFFFFFFWQGVKKILHLKNSRELLSSQFRENWLV